MSRLKELEECGQSVWIDYLKRSFVENGDLRRLIERDGLKGLTSNPSIFEKAIGEGEEYRQPLTAFDASRSAMDVYESLAIADIQSAAAELRPVYDASKGRDGYVSLECSPYLANDTEATIAEALRLHAAVDRPNLMVKVPGTPAGVPAIRHLIGKGVNVNITLLFAVEAYEQVAEAYIAGLEELQKAGGDISRMASVASFFVSRVDTAIDAQLKTLSDKQAAEKLLGKGAIANAKLAYARYKVLFSGPRWEKLASAGAKPQRLLWASTSSKNPAFKDTIYVEELIGRDTVNTVPPATLDAFRDHGVIKPDAIETDVAGAQAVFAALKEHGVPLGEIMDKLVEDGVKLFSDAFDKLLGAIEKERGKLQ
jgi:transaldolase/glucose-6-phosphate isomerase